MFGFLFKLQKKKQHAATRFPPNWPSYLHNKCSVPLCDFPNAPQAASGTYNCQGRIGGSYCNGTYYVSSSMAASMVKNYSFMKRWSNRKSKIHGTAEAEKRRLADQRRGLPLNVSREKETNPSKQRDFNKNKQLPGIPGLDQRKRHHNPPTARPPPSSFTPKPAMPLHGPLYPASVQQYYSQKVHVPRPQEAPSRSGYPNVTAPLVPQRRGPSTKQPLDLSQHRIYFQVHTR